MRCWQLEYCWRKFSARLSLFWWFEDLFLIPQEYLHWSMLFLLKNQQRSMNVVKLHLAIVKTKVCHLVSTMSGKLVPSHVKSFVDVIQLHCHPNRSWVKIAYLEIKHLEHNNIEWELLKPPRLLLMPPRSWFAITWFGILCTMSEYLNLK